MWKGIHIIPTDTKFDFIGQRYFAFFVTAVMIVGSIFLVATKGLNYGIDFTGGTLIEVAVKASPSASVSPIRKPAAGTLRV